ncbi:RNA-directed DNA polymerase (Reverse transcriptase) [Gossypium australe]|uniref:RNA-directed DNA polymerase (Reverse transcriptase) n=1 Tax=Gossypium australe TaxID=47621 RepID=A0A5B6VYZ0_9ROSI|nr:RNA-directed DNA polymerase (Reverse transcriptase) [Gossypium australe]
MQSLMIPEGICEEIERLVRKKLALVNWDSGCQPRSSGGLRFHCLEDHNKSFLMKLGFNLVPNDNALWVRVLHSKYGMNEQLPESISRSLMKW